MEMYNNIKLIICGMALLLFGIIIAIISKNPIAYLFGGLGLYFIIVGCVAKDDSTSSPE
ncbi:hypothetical protein [Thermosediminibacter litoriperuensis]|uniref:Uncharacterized protein n=1 Tax=Thermosediminibacter litoriperuensis TaxID=291989 RepID=A0A5S5AFZ4_9FIRM|nr:hypothetical protein [Thermosediminibacter litoriperuensis]TYP48694.1 hypothetical protein LZ11_02299 [Thermosediminibacter litoriperuensis]